MKRRSNGAETLGRLASGVRRLAKEDVALSADRARPSRAFETYEVAAMAWAALSKYPAERGTAASRFRAYQWRLDPELLLYVLMELAFGGYHAKLLTEKVARERIIGIRERIYESEKQQRNESIRPNKKLRSIADILGVV